MLYLLGFCAVALLVWRLRIRLRLSRAKHPSLQGHARMSRRLAKLVPFYSYKDDEAFSCDGADQALKEKRIAAFSELSNRLKAKAEKTRNASAALEPEVSDMQFTSANRVPFQFRELVRERLPLGMMASETSGVKVRDLDGNWSYDLGGSYGVNLLGYDFYKDCIDRGAARARALGPVLGPYHPVVADNAARIKAISGLDEVSFHMSGTEAVMQAVRLARFNTGRKQLVIFTGAYHGWWDGVQAGVGHGRSLNDIFMLKEMSADTLKVLRTRNDIACVLVNPLQALHPNRGASSDAMLIGGERTAGFDRGAYTAWLHELRDVCTANRIALIFDEVFVGFRLGLGGAQEFFGVNADMVTYGKTIGGGLPVGVLAGKARLMKRFRDDKPADLCFARGTFNSHPYVMATMNEFLRYLDTEEYQSDIADAATTWDARVRNLNGEFETRGLPVRVHNLSSIWILTYTVSSRFNWLFQYYLRAEGLALSWVGTGRLIFSHNYSVKDYTEVERRIIAAAEKMQDGGWWSPGTVTTDKAIKKQVLREMLAHRSAGAPLEPGQAIASRSSSSESAPWTT